MPCPKTTFSVEKIIFAAENLLFFHFKKVILLRRRDFLSTNKT